MVSFRQPLAALAAGTVIAIGLAACSPTETALPETALPEPAAAPTGTEPAAQPPAVTAAASPETAVTKTYLKDGVAISGADPVAYFSEAAFVPGSADYTYEWQGATWQFASAENRDRFASNPEQYAPEYGGFCAWAVAAKNALVPTDPNTWSIVDGKLYLNANQQVQNRWQADEPGFIAQADSSWPTLAQP
ncbi:YHS domain-containing (seleno)protein [Leptolyngbya sp. BC1307]|uniref:YHS domain-containing (seleno)protein n=1 Tax=Leptolyngbya sp. BC1307 TaxID=2029589 RepID=UPI000EFC44C6|nr:YHS domain-containing (seleno)protein [Leptolyngbya sp. BC1307]